MEAMNDDAPLLVTIPHFINTMMNIKSVSWYYKHIKDAGMPQQIYPSGPNGPARLDYQECLAFIERRRKAG